MKLRYLLYFPVLFTLLVVLISLPDILNKPHEYELEGYMLTVLVPLSFFSIVSYFSIKKFVKNYNFHDSLLSFNLINFFFLVFILGILTIYLFNFPYDDNFLKPDSLLKSLRDDNFFLVFLLYNAIFIPFILGEYLFSRVYSTGLFFKSNYLLPIFIASISMLFLWSSYIIYDILIYSDGFQVFGVVYYGLAFLLPASLVFNYIRVAILHASIKKNKFFTIVSSMLFYICFIEVINFVLSRVFDLFVSYNFFRIIVPLVLIIYFVKAPILHSWIEKNYHKIIYGLLALILLISSTILFDYFTQGNYINISSASSAYIWEKAIEKDNLSFCKKDTYCITNFFKNKIYSFESINPENYLTLSSYCYNSKYRRCQHYISSVIRGFFANDFNQSLPRRYSDIITVSEYGDKGGITIRIHGNYSKEKLSSAIKESGYKLIEDEHTNKYSRLEPNDKIHDNEEGVLFEIYQSRTEIVIIHVSIEELVHNRDNVYDLIDDVAINLIHQNHSNTVVTSPSTVVTSFNDRPTYDPPNRYVELYPDETFWIHKEDINRQDSYGLKEKNLVILTLKNIHNNGIIWSNPEIYLGEEGGIFCPLLMVDESGLINFPNRITELKPGIKYSLVFGCRFKNLEEGNSYLSQSFGFSGRGLIGRYGDEGAYFLSGIEFKENDRDNIFDLGYDNFFK